MRLSQLTGKEEYNEYDNEDDSGQEQIIKEKTEIGEAFENLDNDVRNKKDGTSKLDLNSRLSRNDISNVLRFDELQRIGAIPKHWGLTHQFKKLVISENGQGRKEKIMLFQGKVEQSNGSSGWEKFANLFKRKPDNEV